MIFNKKIIFLLMFFFIILFFLYFNFKKHQKNHYMINKVKKTVLSKNLKNSNQNQLQNIPIQNKNISKNSQSTFNTLEEVKKINKFNKK
jgi:predicted PurR-regulated permease PerM